jgi:pantoate kinase
MKVLTKEVTVEVPHRISGFFEIVDKINGVKIINPEKIGSRGAGFNLSSVGKTRMIYTKLHKPEKSSCKILINNVELNEKAETSYFIFNYIRKLTNIPFKVEISHYFDLPVECGFGASGSGALGTIFGLNYLLDLNLTLKECGRIAHIAEVVNKTGLGTVCGQLSGGLTILKEPGYPCVNERIKIPEDIRVICCSFGKIHTKSILSDPKLNININSNGRIALKKLLSNPNLKTFIKVSIEFVKNTEILDILNLHRTKELIENLNRLNIVGASMNQLGRSVYAFCKKENTDVVKDTIDSFNLKNDVYELQINEKNFDFMNRYFVNNTLKKYR